MKYGLITLNISESIVIKLQQFRTKCIRSITDVNKNNDQRNNTQTETEEEWKEKHKTNEQIRKGNMIPTIESKLYGEKLCNIYRWETAKANTYLNNQDELNDDINHISTLCDRLKKVINKKNNNILNKNEQQSWGRLHLLR